MFWLYLLHRIDTHDQAQQRRHLAAQARGKPATDKAEAIYILSLVAAVLMIVLIIAA